MNNKSQKLNAWPIVAGIILICAAAVCLLACFMQDKLTITGDYVGTIKAEQLVCESEVTLYPLFNYDNSVSKSIKINASFESNELSSISLIYKLNYNSTEEISKSEAINHGALNTLSQNEGLGPDAYGAKYSKLGDGLQLSLYAVKNDIDDRALKYFMLENIDSTSYSQEKIAVAYTNKGLKCKIRN